MHHQQPVVSAPLDPATPRRSARLDYGVLVTLVAAVVVLAIMALGISASAVSEETCTHPAAHIASCQAPSAVEPIRP